jgi:hypothetical protein
MRLKLKSEFFPEVEGTRVSYSEVQVEKLKSVLTKWFGKP